MLYPSLSFRNMWTPREIITSLWLDAADNSTVFDAVTGGNPCINNEEVKRWVDKSGNGRHAKSISADVPTYKTNFQNGLGAIYFDPAEPQKVLEWESVLGGGAYDFSIFVVQQTEGDTFLMTHGVQNMQVRIGYNSGLLIFNGGGVVPSYAQSIPRGSVSVVEYIKVGDRVDFWETGSYLHYAQDSSYNYSWIFNRIGLTQFGPGLAGNVCEYIVVNGGVGVNDRQKIEGYLAHKWGLAGNLPVGHPYKNQAP